jgi:hypothetical protein
MAPVLGRSNNDARHGRGKRIFAQDRAGWGARVRKQRAGSSARAEKYKGAACRTF